MKVSCKFQMILLGSFFFSFFTLFAQKDSSVIITDTALQNVTVTAFSLNSNWKNVPASIAVLNENAFKRLEEYNLLPAFNSVPGIRMEERSPGSYRLSIRGSLLRSPFGVRNIKIYMDDLPFTDAGGNSYLQLLNGSELQSVEILKGPASSYYGANTGGAVILHPLSALNNGNNFEGGVSIGNYGTFNQRFSWKTGNSKFSSALSQSHRQSDGYRLQSAYRNDHLQWNGKLNFSQTTLSFFIFYGNLHYETPGGLTLNQMQTNPASARLPAGNFPGAEAQNTGVLNETIFFGSTANHQFSPHFANTTSVVVNHTKFENPFITNFEIRDEWNYSLRTAFYYQKEKPNLSFGLQTGGEFQFNHSNIDVYGNDFGRKDTIQYKNSVKVANGFLFTQAKFTFFNRLYFQSGFSLNNQHYNYRELTTIPSLKKNLREGPVFSPRISLLYRVNKSISIYGIVSKGFSPPTLAEISPSAGNFNSLLKAEFGWNYEGGIKGTILNNRIIYDFSINDFELRNAIVRRNDSAGAEYFVNSGSTSQKGMEVFVKAFIISSGTNWINKISCYNNFSYQPYYFRNYIYGDKDYSGNKITGVPKIVEVAGIDIASKNHFSLHLNMISVASIPFNDANTEFAKPYQLLQMKLGKRFKQEKIDWMVFLGGDNLLNQKYSLGNDINAAGGRYYNPAPPVNFYVGINLKW